MHLRSCRQLTAMVEYRRYAVAASDDTVRPMLFCDLEGSDDDEHDDSPPGKFERQQGL